MATLLEQPQNDSLLIRRELKHTALGQDIRRQIRSGELRPGDQLPSFTELRKQWSVGRETLEKMYRELEQEGLVSREHRRGVFVAHPKPVRQKGTIGFIAPVSMIQHPYYVHLLEGVRHKAQEVGVEVLLIGKYQAVNLEKIDGLIYQATMHDSFPIPLSMPIITLVQSMPHRDSTVADDYIGMAQAMEHLLGLGHKRIALLTVEGQPHALSKLRTLAYQETLSSHGIQPVAGWVRTMSDPGAVGKDWEAVAYDDTQRWLREDWNELGCTAILAHNDEAAIGVIAALHDAGLRVPQDVSVVGFDGTEIARYHRPRLTTVRVPLFEIGARGFELLMQLIQRPATEKENRPLPQCLSLPTQFLPGQTTAPAPR